MKLRFFLVLTVFGERVNTYNSYSISLFNVHCSPICLVHIEPFVACPHIAVHEYTAPNKTTFSFSLLHLILTLLDSCDRRLKNRRGRNRMRRKKSEQKLRKRREMQNKSTAIYLGCGSIERRTMNMIKGHTRASRATSVSMESS